MGPGEWGRSHPKSKLMGWIVSSEDCFQGQLKRLRECRSQEKQQPSQAQRDFPGKNIRVI